ncbi:MAG: uracil-DNA glycosylase [Pseudomonadota bacterium]
MTQKHLLTSVIDETLHTLRDLAEKGSRGFDCSEHGLSVLNSWKRQTTDICHPQAAMFLEPPEPTTPSAPCESDDSPDSSVSVSADTLESIQTDIGDCRRCKLAQHRTRIVFGEGSPSARLMFVGEAPGFDEDQQGKPFVGKAGQLLSRIIQAIDLTREQVYICNVIKCRPPGNRNPEPDEILACSPFLNRQIASIQPEFICALGTFAAQTLLKTTRPISLLRGQFHDYNGIRLLPTFHPSYLLRSPDKKREVWEDMKLLMNEMTP